MVLTHKAYNLTMCLTWAETELSAPGADRFSVPGATSSASESPSTPIADSQQTCKMRTTSIHHLSAIL